MLGGPGTQRNCPLPISGTGFCGHRDVWHKARNWAGISALPSLVRLAERNPSNGACSPPLGRVSAPWPRAAWSPQADGADPPAPGAAIANARSPCSPANAPAAHGTSLRRSPRGVPSLCVPRASPAGSGERPAVLRSRDTLRAVPVRSARGPAGDNPAGEPRLRFKSSRPSQALPVPGPVPRPGGAQQPPRRGWQRTAAGTAFRSRCKSIAAPWQLYFHAPMLFFHSVMGRMTLCSFGSFASFSSFLASFLSQGEGWGQSEYSFPRFQLIENNKGSKQRAALLRNVKHLPVV